MLEFIKKAHANIECIITSHTAQGHLNTISSKTVKYRRTVHKDFNLKLLK